MTRILISGCSGGGKSTLLAELARLGHATVQEPGRLIVQQQVSEGGTALPWEDTKGFLDLVLEKAVRDFERASGHLTFFDRGIVDAAIGLQRLGHPCPDILALHRYDNPVFLAPPWPEIYKTDAERQHSFDDAVAEYNALNTALPQLGYNVVRLPKISVENRISFVLDNISR